ncbi:TIGR00266 family protein [Anaerosolibacter sp.]|uniref:TIGR00266 family protein n=1 Tax=Anaerosolibacter sp. TaxID=1872527 RepID=UPI0039F034DF
MKYEIRGGSLPVVLMELQRGESVFTESGGMGWMTDDFNMETNMEGGLFGGIARKLTGESLFMTTYTCTAASGTIAFPSSFPGKILPMALGNGQSVICQKKSFLCGERAVNLEIFFRKKLGSGLFGGEGFILQKITGPGLAFMEFDGEVVEYTLGSGEVMKVDTGHVAMFEPTVSFDIEMLKGFKNMLFGGEGLFLARLQGPGKVWLQTMPIQNLAKNIIPFIPPSGKD